MYDEDPLLPGEAPALGTPEPSKQPAPAVLRRARSPGSYTPPATTTAPALAHISTIAALAQPATDHNRLAQPARLRHCPFLENRPR